MVTRNISKVDEPTSDETKVADSTQIEKEDNESIESINQTDLIESSSSHNGTANLDEEAIESDEVAEGEEENMNETNEFVSPKKRKRAEKSSSVSSKSKKSLHGTSFTEIPGTPIVNNTMGGTDKVPDWEKFSENICAHKPFEMNPQTPTGSYQNIVKLTKKFKSNSSLNHEITKDF